MIMFSTYPCHMRRKPDDDCCVMTTCYHYTDKCTNTDSKVMQCVSDRLSASFIMGVLLLLLHQGVCILCSRSSLSHDWRWAKQIFGSSVFDIDIILV